MSGPNLKSIRKRENRAKHREKYHHGTFIAEYIHKKYKEIYNEADDFYQKLYRLHPNKTKLTTCVEFKAWEAKLKQDSATATTSSTRMYKETTSTIEINIPLMNDNEVQQTKDMIIFEGIQPSLTEQINPQIIEEILQELHQSDITHDMFNDDEDEDMNEMINNAIDDSLSELEKELLYY